MPADKKQPLKYVKGIHQGIVSEADFWMAQEMLGNKKPSKTQPAEKFPLKGLLKCHHCGMNLTASYSKGKRDYYLYYRCIKHSNYNISGIRVHEAFWQLLDELSLSNE